MASGGAHRRNVMRTTRVERRVGGGLYDALETDDSAVAAEWVNNIPTQPLDRVIGVAFIWKTRFNSHRVLDTLYLSIFSRVLLLRLPWGVASLPANVRWLLMNPSNLFVGDDVHVAAMLLHASAGGEWMPQRLDLGPLAAQYRVESRLAYALPHEVLARTMLGLPEEHLVQSAGPVCCTLDDLAVQSCVVAQHVARSMLGGGGGAG